MDCKPSLLGSFIVCFLIALSGCGETAPNFDVASYNDTNIKRLRNAYEMYKLNHGNVGPKDEDSLREYLTGDEGASVRLKRMGVDVSKIDDIFVSERDGQPFKVRWALEGPADHAIVFESEGVGGKRLVAFYKPKELGAEEYEGYWTGKIKPESPEEFDIDQPEAGAKDGWDGEAEVE